MKKLYYLLVVVIFSSTNYSQSINDLIGKSDRGFQSISVTLGGSFIVTGTFSASVTERVDQFVTRIYAEAKEISVRNITDPKLLSRINEELNNYSLRNILLKRSNGEAFNLDLEMYHLDGDLTNNPYLKNDDVLIFDPVDLERNFFSINGAVNRPGKFHFVNGDDLRTAIKLAMGLNPAYRDLAKAEISRLSYDGQSLKTIEIDLNSDFKLERGDRIVVKAVETQKKDFKVYVYGEVNSPGEIPISKNNSTLKEVILSAGGLTDMASLKQARLFTGAQILSLFERQYGIKIQQKEMELDENVLETFFNLEKRLMYRMSSMTEQDTAYFFLENYIRLINETGSIDFTKLMDENSTESLYTVRDGDVIFIPQKESTIYVLGQVRNPGKIKFVKDKDYTYYLAEAGGIGEYADDEIMIIKNRSREWISPEQENIKLEEGDFIWVPRSTPRSFNYYVYSVGGYLSIVASAATIILLLIQLGK